MSSEVGMNANIQTVFPMNPDKKGEVPLVFISVELDIAHGTDVPMAGKILFCVVHYRSSFFCCLDRRVFSLFFTHSAIGGRATGESEGRRCGDAISETASFSITVNQAGTQVLSLRNAANNTIMTLEKSDIEFLNGAL